MKWFKRCTQPRVGEEPLFEDAVLDKLTQGVSDWKRIEDEWMAGIEALPEFGTVGSCPKCGTRLTGRRTYKVGMAPRSIRHREWLEIACQCGWVHREKPRDAGEH